MFFTILSLSFEFEILGSIFRTLTLGQRKQVVIQTKVQHFCKFANNDWIEWFKGREHLPRCLKHKSKFLYVYDYHFQLFSVFEKKYPEVRFRLLIFFHSHFYLLNLFRLGCLFLGISGIYSLSFIITRYEMRKNCFFFHFYCN